MRFQYAQKILFPTVGLMLCLTGCIKKLTDFAPPLATYYPVVENQYRTLLEIDSSYTDTSRKAKLTLRREITGSTVTDLLGRTLHLLEIDTAHVTNLVPASGVNPYQVSADSFAYSELWQQYEDAGSVEEVHGNIRYLLLNRPIQKGINWNGNLYNGSSAAQYSYLNIDSTLVDSFFTATVRQFPNCVVVQQALAQNLLLKQNTFEIYAPGIGRVYRYDKHFEYTQNTFTLQFDFNASASYIRRQVLIDYHTP